MHSSRAVQEQGQRLFEEGIAKLNQKIDNLKDTLGKRDINLERSLFRFKGEDTIKRSGNECLESAGRSVGDAYTASCQSTPASIAGRRFASGDIPAWNREVMQQVAAEPIHPQDLDAMTGNITNETRSLGHGDSGYDSDQISRFRPIPDRREGFSANSLTNFINRSVNEAQKYREAGQHDNAAEAQAKAVKWGRERQKKHRIEFKDEHDMLWTLAKIQLERHMYGHAEEILLDLLKVVGADSPDALTLDHELAGAYLAHGKYESAARYANRANNGRQGALKVGDNKIIETLRLLSEIYDKMGNRTEATVFRQEALQHRIRQKGRLNEVILNTLKQEGVVVEDLHKVIDDLEDSEAKDILVLKTFQ